MQCTPEDIHYQQELLQLHRNNAHSYYRQAVICGGLTFAPIEVQYGLKEASAGIAACKALLREWGISVDDRPQDTVFTFITPNHPANNNDFKNFATNAGFQGIATDVTINNYNNSHQQQDHKDDIFTNYRYEIIERYRVWRERYVHIDLRANTPLKPSTGLGFERESQFFRAFNQIISSHPGDQQHRMITFTDLREGLSKCGDIALLGPPGAGKTTALWRLALDLAEDGLQNNTQAQLPIFVRLSNLKSEQDLIAHIQSELNHLTLEDEDQRPIDLPGHQALAPLVPKLLKEGRIVLLWDGLNETSIDTFANTARKIERLRYQHRGPLGGPTNKHILTCRTDDYNLLVLEHNIDLPLTRTIIQPFNTKTVEKFVHSYLGNQNGDILLKKLSSSHHRTLAGLARTPLLLTMLCAIYYQHNTLPDTRGTLLEAFIQQRIRWEQDRQQSSQLFSPYDLAWPLARLAYAMIEHSWRGTSVSWEWAEQQLAAAGTSLSPTRVRTLALSADLLEPLAGGRELRFTHQLIQEYFAAVALREELARLEQHHNLSPERGDLGLLARFAAPGRRTGWEETLLLLAGLDGDRTLAPTLVRRFLSYPLEAARLLLASGDTDPNLLAEVRELALAQIRAPNRPVQTRITAARALALVGDPRFPVTIDAWDCEIRRARNGDPEGYFCRVEPGDYWLGNTEPGGPDEQPRHRVTFDAPFWIARLPITRAQWRAWAEADGGAPDPDDNIGSEQANQPIADATWAQVRAFCDWLSHHLGTVVRLPTEHEWEAAAAGPAGLRYPWGNGWVSDCAATRENRETRGNTHAPVGCYPAGKSPCDALDLAGNVWEWTLERPTSDPDQDWPTLRGGNHQSHKHEVRCAARSTIDQPDEAQVAGFRVVVLEK